MGVGDEQLVDPLVPATLFDGTAVPVITPSCRLIMANIVADVILSALPAIRSALLSGGYRTLLPCGNRVAA